MALERAGCVSGTGRSGRGDVYFGWRDNLVVWVSLKDAKEEEGGRGRSEGERLNVETNLIEGADLGLLMVGF